MRIAGSCSYNPRIRILIPDAGIEELTLRWRLHDLDVHAVRNAMVLVHAAALELDLERLVLAVISNRSHR